jgi:hypothetical protein
MFFSHFLLIIYINTSKRSKNNFFLRKYKFRFLGNTLSTAFPNSHLTLHLIRKKKYLTKLANQGNQSYLTKLVKKVKKKKTQLIHNQLYI